MKFLLFAAFVAVGITKFKVEPERFALFMVIAFLMLFL